LSLFQPVDLPFCDFNYIEAVNEKLKRIRIWWNGEFSIPSTACIYEHAGCRWITCDNDEARCMKTGTCKVENTTPYLAERLSTVSKASK
jgi:hypothetical protein